MFVSIWNLKKKDASILIYNDIFAVMNEFYDDQLGPVVIKRNGRAKKIIVRRKYNVVEVTVPSRLSNKEIIEHFKNLKPKILALPKQEVVKITEESVIETFTFNVEIVRQTRFDDKIGMHLNNGILKLDVHPSLDISSLHIQLMLKDMIIYALRAEAKRVLPTKVLRFAKKLGLEVNEIKINKSKHRWGSCSEKKNITLSLFLMMLPEHLIDYVILHELAHTIELNHSRRFWQILDKFCNGKAEELNHESTYWDTDYLFCLKQ